MVMRELKYCIAFGARVQIENKLYRGDPPIRNSQFPIWAKGKGVLGPSKPPFLRNIPLSKADFLTMAGL